MVKLPRIHTDLRYIEQGRPWNGPGASEAIVRPAGGCGPPLRRATGGELRPLNKALLSD